MSTSTSLVEKTFLILEVMAELDVAVPLKVLFEKTQLPKSTLHRLLHSLTNLGYVEQDSLSGNYFLTRQLALLGRSNRYASLKDAILPLMQQLHKKFNETVNLAVLEGSFIYYLQALETTQTLRWIVTPGARDSFHCTALGKAISAFLPEETRTRLLYSANLTQRTPNTITSKRALHEALDKVRANGFAVDDEENDLGVICFAIPLLQNGLPVAGISISLPKVRLTNDINLKIKSTLKETLKKSQKVIIGSV